MLASGELLTCGTEPPVARPLLRTSPPLQLKVREAPGPDAPSKLDDRKPLRATVAPSPADDGGGAPTPATRGAAPTSPPANAPDAAPDDDANSAESPPDQPTDLAAPREFSGDAPSEIPSEVFAAQFQGIVPGETTREQLVAKLGEPKQRGGSPANLLLTYAIGPFPRVEFRLTDDVVQSIRVQFAEPMARKKVVGDLDLGDFESTPLADDQGEIRGEIVPERGLQLTYVRDSEPPAISQVLLETPRAAHFVKRAQQDPQQRYQRMLSDLSVARRLGPASSEALALEARIRQRLGQPAAALELAAAALLESPSSAPLRLLKARLLGENGRHDEAAQLVEQTLSDTSTPPALRAYARCVQGELILASPTGRPDRALANFQSAIAAAGELGGDPDGGMRRTSQEILFVAYLGGASAIAQGKWQQRAATVDKWWNSSQTLVKELYDDSSGALERWDVDRRRLELAALAGGRLPSQEIETLRAEARRLEARAADPLLANRLDWELAEALLHAAELAQANELWPEAREFAEEGLERAKTGAASREPNFSTAFLQGRLAFLIGSYHAVTSKDAEQTKLWFDRAATTFETPHELPLVERLRQGERLVFLGQGYADLDDPDAALRWLARGVQLLEPLAQQGLVAPGRAAAPLERLAALHAARDDEAQAEDLRRRARHLKSGEAVVRSAAKGAPKQEAPKQEAPTLAAPWKSGPTLRR